MDGGIFSLTSKDASLKADSFVPETYQAVLWTSGFDVTSKALSRLASSSWSSTFDGDPTLIPSGQKLPVEVPKLSIASTDERWRLQIGTSRAELLWQRVGDAASVSAADFASISTKTLREYLAESDELVVSRLAFVTRRFSIVPEPAKEIARYFVRDEILGGPLKRPNEFQLNAHKVYQPENMPTVNSWIRWRNGFLAPTGEPVVTVEQDLNTLADAQQSFAIDKIGDFLTRAPNEANSILAYYLSFDNPPS